MENKKEKIFLILDSNSLLHRAFHALPPLTNKRGEPVGSIYGFLSVLWKIIRETKPDLVAACFDCPGPTLRHKEFKKYKAKRPPLDPALKPQIEKAKEILKILNVPVFEKEKYEADDIIGFLTREISKRQIFPKIKVKILSGDLDLLQLIDSNVTVLLMKTGVKDIPEYDIKKVKEKYNGLLPSQIVDFKALRGDPSDNIPGVSGIGEKTAISLLNNFNNLENLYFEIENQTEKSRKIKEKIKTLLLQQKEQAFLSKSLAKIKKDIDLNFDIGRCYWGKYKKEEFIKKLEELGFKSLIKRFFPSEIKEKKEEKTNIQKRLIN